MLDFAYYHQPELQEALKRSHTDRKFQYWRTGIHHDYVINVAEDSWSQLQMVSVKDNKVLGYFACSFQRDTKAAFGVQAVNFSHKNDIVFSRDFFAFIDNLFEVYACNKIDFKVLVGNPIERSYDRFIARHNGRVVGYYKDEFSLLDGSLHDAKIYEIMREDYTAKRKKKVVISA